jgi:hypothetical protein
MNEPARIQALDYSSRRRSTKLLTFSMATRFRKNLPLPLSHDEVVHGKRSLIGAYAGRLLAAVRKSFVCLPFPQIWPPGRERVRLIMGHRDPRQFHVMAILRRPSKWFLLDFEAHRLQPALIRELNSVYAAGRLTCGQTTADWPRLCDRSDADNAKQSILNLKRQGREDADLLLGHCSISPPRPDTSD